MIAHYTAVKDRLLADAVLSARGVYDAARQESANNPALVRAQYLILFASPGELDDARLTAAQSADSDAEYLYTVRAVGVSADAVLQMMQRVYTQLSGFIPTIPGRNCNPLVLDGEGQQVEPDMSVTPPLFYLDVDVTLRSSRA